MSNSEYLKRYAAPKSWIIHRKAYRLISKPNPGPHPLENGIPLGLFMLQLGHGQTAREIRKVLNTKEILVDGRRIKDPRLPVGLFDTVKITELKKSYRVSIDLKGRLVIKEDDNADQKPCKIIGKTMIKGGKVQINLVDGRNMLVKDNVNVGDTLLLELPSQKIVKHLKLEKGANVLITSGRYVGNTAKVDGIEGNTVSFTVDKNKSETNKDHIYVTQ